MSESKPKLKVIIPRHLWWRNAGSLAQVDGLHFNNARRIAEGRATLEEKLQTEPKLCCLGHLGLACGFGVRQLGVWGVPQPEDGAWPLDTYESARGLAWTEDDENWISKAVDVNDNLTIHNANAEAMLIAHFAKRGFELSFVDGEVTKPPAPSSQDVGTKEATDDSAAADPDRVV